MTQKDIMQEPGSSEMELFYPYPNSKFLIAHGVLGDLETVDVTEDLPLLHSNGSLAMVDLPWNLTIVTE